MTRALRMRLQLEARNTPDNLTCGPPSWSNAHSCDDRPASRKRNQSPREGTQTLTRNDDAFMLRTAVHEPCNLAAATTTGDHYGMCTASKAGTGRSGHS